MKRENLGGNQWARRRIGLIAIVAFIAAASSAFGAPTIHVFNVIANAYPGEGGAINEGVTADRQLIHDLLREQIPEQGWGVKVEWTELVGDQVTADGMLGAWQALVPKVGPEDTVFAYFSGHGAVAKADPTLQILQTCDGGLVDRTDWAKAIESLPCRLKILITDCCSTFSEIAVAEGDERVLPWTTLYFLLLRHEGFVNITAASPGEAAYATPIGSFLTVNLHSDMQRYQTWEAVFKATRSRVIEETDADAPARQTPLAHSLARPIDDGASPRGQAVPAERTYVIPDSNLRPLTRKELERMGLQQLYIARNEIAARRGYVFKTPLLDTYFRSRPWYRPKPGSGTDLDGVEGKNAALIKEVEIAKGGPFMVYIDRVERDDPAPDIFPYSSQRALSRTVVEGLNRMQLSVARNEIYARHGYAFGNRMLREYFELKPYYRSSGSKADPKFTSVERQNLWLIRKIERIRGGPYKWE